MNSAGSFKKKGALEQSRLWTGKTAGLWPQNGFTLIETVLAITILGIVLAMALSALRLGIKSKEKGTAVTEFGRAERGVFSRFSREVASMYPYTVVNGKSKELVFTGMRDGVGFVTSFTGQGSNIPYTGFKWVYYSVKDNVFTVREKAVTSDSLAEDDGGMLVQLEVGVHDVVFEYASADGKWEESWDAGVKKGLPRGVRAVVNFKGGAEALTVLGVVGVSH